MADIAMKGWQDGKWEVPEWEFEGKPALLILHMQQGIVGTRAFSAIPHEQEAEAIKEGKILENQKKLLKAFRAKKLPIIFVSVVPNPIGFQPKWGFIFEIRRQKAPVGRLDNPALKAGTELIPELDRQPGEYLLHHTGIGAFTGSHLNDVLKHHEVHDLVLAGYAAHAAVYNAVVQAVDNWYSVVVARDATGGPKRDQKAVDAVLNFMMWMWGLVTTTDDVIAHL